jgi:hypothetical protein
VYSLIWAQCTEEYLKAKLEAKEGHIQVKTDYDTIKLSRTASSNSQIRNMHLTPFSLHEVMRKFYTSQQDKTSNTQDYYQ